MKRSLIALLIRGSLLLVTNVNIRSQTDAALTNAIVAKMVRDGLSAEVVIAKIKTSQTAFDTSPEELSRLKAAGISDAVILAMVQSGPSSSGMKSQVGGAHVAVRDGQQLEVELARTASGEDLQVGDIVDFSVTQDVIIDGVMVIEKGAPARATITTAKRARHWGRAGKLEWAMKDVMTVDGTRVPVRFTKRAVGDSKGGTVAAAAVATTVLVGPLSLLWGLKRGKSAIIPAGNRYTVFIHGDVGVSGRRVS